MNTLNNPISLNTLMTELNHNKPASIELSFNICFSGCNIEYKLLQLSIEDTSIIFKDTTSHPHNLKIDITSILYIQAINNYEYQINTNDCEIKILL